MNFSSYQVNNEMTALLFACFLALIGREAYYRWIKSTNNEAKLPPGPKGLPLVGNMFDFPPASIPEYRHWAKLREKYGPVISLSILGQKVIVIHDLAIAEHLMNVKLSKTSSRPHMTFANEMAGFDNILVSKSPKLDLQLYRKIAYDHLGTEKKVSQFWRFQEMETARLLLLTLDNPNDLIRHFKVYLQFPSLSRKKCCE